MDDLYSILILSACEFNRIFLSNEIIFQVKVIEWKVLDGFYSNSQFY